MTTTVDRRPAFRLDVRTLLGVVPILGIVAVAALLRLQDLQQPLTDHFAWREANAAMMADNLPLNGWNLFLPEISWMGDEPGYQGRELPTLTFLAAILDAILGWDDWHGRAIAVLSGAWTTFALYRLTRLLAGERQALVTAAVYAVLPGAVLIDRSYLPDPMMLALTLTSLWLVAEGMVRSSRALCIAGWALGILAILAKLTALAALPALLYLVVFGRRPWLEKSRLLNLELAVTTAIIAATAYYAWAYWLGANTPPYQVAGRDWLLVEGWRTFLDADFHLPVFRWHVETWLWGSVVIALGGLGLFYGVAGRPDDPLDRARIDAPWFFHAWMAGCVLFYVLAAKELESNSWNLHVMNPVAAALAGNALVQLARHRTGRLKGLFQVALVTCALALIVVQGRSGLAQMKTDEAKDDYRLGQRIAGLSCPDELVVAVGGIAGSPVATYYSRRKGFLWPTPDDAPGGNYALYADDGSAAIAALDRLVARGAGWFGYVRGARDSDGPPKSFEQHYSGLIAHLRAKARLVEENDSYVLFDLAPLAGTSRSCPAG